MTPQANDTLGELIETSLVEKALRKAEWTIAKNVELYIDIMEDPTAKPAEQMRAAEALEKLANATSKQIVVASRTTTTDGGKTTIKETLSGPLSTAMAVPTIEESHE